MVMNRAEGEWKKINEQAECKPKREEEEGKERRARAGA